MRISPEAIPEDFPVQPIDPDAPARDAMTCGDCGLTWDDGIPTSWTPVPSGRCPFEYFHVHEVHVAVLDPQGSMGGFEWRVSKEDAEAFADELGRDLVLGIVPVDVDGDTPEEVTDEIDAQLGDLERQLGYVPDGAGELESDKLRRAAAVLRDLGGEDNYTLADACEDAAQREEEI